MPEILRDLNIARVAEKYCGADFDKAEAMMRERPARFFRLLNLADALSEAEPLQMKWMQQKAEQKSKSDKFARQGIPGAPPPIDAL